MLAPASEVDVVVPSYGRPGLLRRCLTAIAAQEYAAARVIVVVRTNDDASKQAARESGLKRGELDVIEVGTPGVLAAMRAGVAASSSPTIAFTDDDARPRPDWLWRISDHLVDPTVGGVGGRDIVPGQEGPLTPLVGRFTRFGKFEANHHLGTGPARDVEVLKGVNMAFRAEALALSAPGVLRGQWGEMDYEVLTCAWAQHHGWRLIYDPAIIVDHEGGPREGADQRARPAAQTVFDTAYNSVVAVTALAVDTPWRRIAYPLIVGSSDRPGVIRGVVAFFRGEREVLERLRPALEGRIAALRARRGLIGSESATVVTASALRHKP